MTIFYRTRETGANYGFDFVWTGSSYRIDIMSQPSYATRGAGMVATHRLGAPGRWHICWDSPIPTIDQAKTIACNWAEGTDRYIKSGNSATAFAGPLIMDYAEDPQAAATFARIDAERMGRA